MWPWEHAVIGYIGYSLFCHLYYRDSPNGLATLVVVVAAVLPDLVDKPLAWEFGVFDSGFAVGHSVFFAIPLAIFVWVLATVAGRPRVGVGFGIGYLLHLPGDVIPYYLLGGPMQLERILWPIVPTGSTRDYEGLFEEFWQLFAGYRAEILSGDPSSEVMLGLVLAAIAFVLWLYDRVPVLREILIGTKRLLVAAVTMARGETRGSRRSQK